MYIACFLRLLLRERLAQAPYLAPGGVGYRGAAPGVQGRSFGPDTLNVCVDTHTACHPRLHVHRQFPGLAASAELKFREDFLKRLVDAVPASPESGPGAGRFGKGNMDRHRPECHVPARCRGSLESPENPCYLDPNVLEA